MENDFIEEDQEIRNEEDEDEEMGEPAALSDDSSEEPEEDEEEARRIRENFIVDEDEEADEPSEDERRRKRRKRRKKAREDALLEEDDLDLLEENTGRRVDRQRLTRIRRIRDSESPPAPSPSTSRARASQREDEDEFGNEKDIERIWEDDDERQGVEGIDDEEMDMDDFIDDDEQDEGMAEEEREERRRERKRLEKERYRALGARPELSGIDAGAWDEIFEVFGDGTDYDWALEDDEIPQEEETLKAELKFADVFEPSEIKAKMLTDEDDVIRLQDRPERMQLANSTLSSSSSRLTGAIITKGDLDDAAHWITIRLSDRHERDYFRPDGVFHPFLMDLISAVRTVIDDLFIENFEVPYIYAHKRDYLNLFDPDQPSHHVEFLGREDLWRIYTLGVKYQALLERRRALQSLYERLQIADDYFEKRQIDELDSVESIADATEWIGLKYRTRKKDDSLLRFHDDLDVEAKPKKLPSRMSDYEVVKNSILSRLADDFGLKSHEVVANYRAGEHAVKEYFVDDQELPPIVHAEAFGDPNQERLISPELLLQQARMLLATELGKDPLLRKDVRERFKSDGLITVIPTEKGLTKIDDHHPYNQFKYLRAKPVKLLIDSPQFLHILAAEAEHLITFSIELSAASLHELQSSLSSAFISDSFSDAAKAWNEQRLLVVQEAVEKHLIPVGTKWIREWIRDEAQSNLALKCGEILRQRINVRGFEPRPEDRLPGVVAISWGKGDPQKDAITAVYLDENGVLRDNIKLDNLLDTQNRDLFLDLIARREPAVVVVGGLSIRTAELVQEVKKVLSQQADARFEVGFGSQKSLTPVIYAFDEVARMYQHSKRASEEFSALSLTAKYCVGIARYTQSPINEYAALGEDLAALTLDDEFQNLVPKEKLLLVLERVLVDVVNEVGVDVNRTVTDPYYKYLLPFVSGLGPRKAQSVIRKIASLGGNLINRAQFIRGEIMTRRIFENAAGFLRISQSSDTRLDKNRSTDEADLPDPLDDTRIHPADYELARKMAADALDLDEEDIQDEHPSYVVLQIKQAVDGARRLDELNLDDFAVNMFRDNGDRKRHTLNTIRDELLHPFTDRRPQFPLPVDWDVLTMLTSETQRTLRVGLIVSVTVSRIKEHYINVKLDSGLEGVINVQYLSDEAIDKPANYVKKGQTLLGVIIDVRLDLANDTFGLELSSRPSDVSVGDINFRKVPIDEDFYDVSQYQKDKELLQRRKRSENDRTRRVIKHPNFHNFNSVQAEAYLSKQQRGDAIVRPSSKGSDHLAVTWKVDEGLFQHIDVLDPNADITKQTVGQRLIVDNGDHEFADLDELIVNYVQALTRKVEEIMSHEKYKRGSDESIRKELNDYIQANPAKSIYCFTLNRKKPGHFNIVFKANPASPVQVWPVRVTPRAYYLFDTAVPSVPELCDAFKYQFIHRSSLGANGPSGGKTPYGGRTPGRRTPGRMSVRQVGRTPNPYESSGPGGHVNPQRAAMIESTGGWGTR